MRRIAEIIVKYCKIILILFVIAGIACAFMIPKVNIVNDLAEYLSEETETRQGVDIMNEEFVTLGSAKVMIDNISYQDACELAERLEEIKGVSTVSFYDEEEEEETEITDGEGLKDFYNELSALISITFETEEEDELARSAIAKVREALSEYDTSFFTTVDKDDNADLQKDMQGTLVVSVIIIIAVLLFTSGTYMEIPIFMLVFSMAALLNMGTNFIFGDVSFITNAVSPILQMALAIDYAIILFHRFMEERERVDTEEALTRALEKGISEITSSSLTTIAGMAALMFMDFGIGMDLGRVLVKAIALSMLSVFGFLPGLIVLFEKQIVRTMHRSFVPNISAWGRLVVATGKVILPLFPVVIVLGIVLSSRCNFVYDQYSIQSSRMREYMTSKNAIAEKFDMDNSMAIIVPKGDYESEAAILAEIEKLHQVEAAMGLANVTVDEEEEYVLTDALSPQELAGIINTDIDVVRMLYRFYAWKNEKYGAFMDSIDEFEIPLIDMVDFIYGEEENATFDFPDNISDDIREMHKSITEARQQLEGEEYARLLFTMSGPVEGEETFETIDRVREIAQKYYREAYVIGDSTSDYDLSKSFSSDNRLISIMTAAFVFIILLFTFSSLSLPVLLVTTIQTSIWINFSIPYLTDSPLYFLGYLVVSAIQMGATIDYAIVITSRYTELRQTIADKKAVVIETLNQCFATIITSGSIMALSGFTIGMMSSEPIIASLGKTMGFGALISIILVMLVLPQLLYLCDGLIQKTYLKKGKTVFKEREVEG